MKYSKRVSLKFRLTFMTVLLIVFPMLIATIYNSINYSNNAKKDLMKSLESQNYSVRQMIDIEIDNVSRLAKNIAEDKGVTVTLQFNIDSQLFEYIKKLENDNRKIDKLVIYNKLSNNFLGNGEDKELEQVIKYSLKNDYLDGIYNNHEFSIISTKPIKNSSNEIIGVVCIKSSMIKHTDYISEIGDKLNLNMILMEENKIFLMRDYKTGFVIPNKKIPVQLPTEIPNANMFSLDNSININERSYHMFLSKIYNIYDQPIGYIGTLSDTTNFKNSLKDIFFNMILISLFGVFLAILLSIIALNSLLSPLSELIRTLEKIRKGGLHERVRIKRKDEIGLVGEYFNKTVEQIETMVEEIDEANEQLKESDRIKDEFLANTSHELRTPLNGIIGLSQSLYYSDKLSKDQKELVYYIMISGKRLLTLINDLLDFSKLQKGTLIISKEPTDIRNLTDVVLMLNKPLADEKQLYLINKIPENFPMILGDRLRLEQILHNLVSNAIKFTEEGGVKIEAKLKGEYAEIAVRDTGIGIPKDKFDIIFERFMQVDGSISRKYGGTGLGLAVVKNLVELHDGEIYVESEVDKGSTFYFYLPIVKTKENEKLDKQFAKKNEMNIEPPLLKEEKRDKKLLDSNKPNILVVDDEVINLKILENNLEEHGYNVTKAADGIQAINFIREVNYDFSLIVLDVMMPRMSGYQVSKILRENYSKDDLPILIVTAKNSSEDIIEAYESGANDFLSKPFEFDELHSKIKSLIESTGGF